MASRTASGSGFQALWLLDLAGLAAASLFALLLAAPAWLPTFLKTPFVGEACLALAAVALTVRLVDGRNRLRTERLAQRRELLRRLGALDEALMDLRRSLSREAARRFIERRDDFAARLQAAQPWLDPEDQRLADEGLRFCATLTTGLADVIPRRAAIVSTGYRIGQEIDRAARRGELDDAGARHLHALIDDALAVLDEALFAEWNADHFGRLGAVQRHFGRLIDGRGGEAARGIDRDAARLFEALIAHVRDKIGVVDALRGWEDVRRPLEFSLSEVKPRPRRRLQPLPPRPSVASRFALAPLAVDRGEAEPPARLPAAND